MQKSWDFAVDNVLKSETKIRMETKIIGGEEIDCLVYVPSQSPKLSEKSIRQTRGATVKTFDKVRHQCFIF
jgi:hypothetical protein